MISNRAGRAAFGVAFVVLLLDGIAAVWLGQLTAHRALFVVGIVLMGAALSVSLLYQRWLRALEDVERARRELMAELGALKRAAAEARAGGLGRGDAGPADG